MPPGLVCHANVGLAVPAVLNRDSVLSNVNNFSRGGRFSYLYGIAKLIPAPAKPLRPNILVAVDCHEYLPNRALGCQSRVVACGLGKLLLLCPRGRTVLGGADGSTWTNVGGRLVKTAGQVLRIPENAGDLSLEEDVVVLKEIDRL